MSGATAAGVNTFDHPIAGAVVPPGPGPSKPMTAATTHDTHQKQQQQQAASAMAGVMGSLRVIELQLVAFIMVFSASGLVPLIDLAFPAFATLYFLALSRLAFPSLPTGSSSAPSIYDAGGGALFRLYVVLGTVVGLFLPLAYVLGGFARGDETAVRAAAPHLFLLALQILTENAISGLGVFSPPVRALVPTVYTVRRVFVVLDWAKDAWLNKSLPANATVKDATWMWFGKGLAVANLVYFSSNLLCFLVPCFLPRAFERYFRDRNELMSKAAEDRRSSVSSPSPAASETTKTRDAKKSD